MSSQANSDYNSKERLLEFISANANGRRSNEVESAEFQYSKLSQVSATQSIKPRVQKRKPENLNTPHQSLKRLNQDLEKDARMMNSQTSQSQQNSSDSPKSGSQQQLCAICLHPPSVPSGTLPCHHSFCLQCIDFWSKNTSNRCPYCRGQFFSILSSLHEQIPVTAKTFSHQDNPDDYLQDPCYVCHTFDRIQTLLLCEICQNRCCHIECDSRLESQPQVWICRFCEGSEEGGGSRRRREGTRRERRKRVFPIEREYGLRKRKQHQPPKPKNCISSRTRSKASAINVPSTQQNP